MEVGTVLLLDLTMGRPTPIFEIIEILPKGFKLRQLRSRYGHSIGDIWVVAASWCNQFTIKSKEKK